MKCVGTTPAFGFPVASIDARAAFADLADGFGETIACYGERSMWCVELLASRQNGQFPLIDLRQREPHNSHYTPHLPLTMKNEHKAA